MKLSHVDFVAKHEHYSTGSSLHKNALLYKTSNSSQWLDRLFRLRLSFFGGGEVPDEVVVKETTIFSLSAFTAKPGNVFPTHFQG